MLRVIAMSVSFIFNLNIAYANCEAQYQNTVGTLSNNVFNVIGATDTRFSNGKIMLSQVSTSFAIVPLQESPAGLAVSTGIELGMTTYHQYVLKKDLTKTLKLLREVRAGKIGNEVQSLTNLLRNDFPAVTHADIFRIVGKQNSENKYCNNLNSNESELDGVYINTKIVDYQTVVQYVANQLSNEEL